MCLSVNQMLESQVKYPGNKECMVSDYLRKVTSYQLLVTLNFSARSRDRILFLKEGTESKIFHSLNHAPFTPYVPSPKSNEHNSYQQPFFLPNSDLGSVQYWQNLEEYSYRRPAGFYTASANYVFKSLYLE